LICFLPQYQRQQKKIEQDLLTIENTVSDLKVHALHYANELLVCVRLSFQKLLKIDSTCRNKKKFNVWEKSNDAYSLLSADYAKPHFDLSFATISASKKMFSSERKLKKALPNTLTRAAWYGLLSATNQIVWPLSQGQVCLHMFRKLLSCSLHFLSLFCGGTNSMSNLHSGSQLGQGISVEVYVTWNITLG